MKQLMGRLDDISRLARDNQTDVRADLNGIRLEILNILKELRR